MRLVKFGAALASAALSLCLIPGHALAQAQKPTLYSFHSGPNGSCPGLDWHITATGTDLEGFVAVNHSTRIWRVEGKVIPTSVGQERSFELEAKEMGGANRTATIKGTSGGEFLNATITGAGTPCDGKMLVIPRVENGIEGGGG